MNINRLPLITIVTVVYNDVYHIENTMLSVINQTYPNIQYIIIDGGSTDGTVDVIKKYEDKISYWVSEPDKGIYDAMNKGLEKVTGEWVNFMNSGDSFFCNKTLNQLFEQEIPLTTGVVFGDTYTKKGLLKMIPFIKNKSRKKIKDMGICHQSIFVKTKMAKMLKFRMIYKVAADYDMIKRCYDSGCGFYYVPVPVSVYDMNGFSRHHALQQLKEVAIICEGYGTFEYYLKYIEKFIKITIRKCLNI